MNKAAVLDAIDPDQFDMADYYAETSCGTFACLAGWTCLVMGMQPDNVHTVSRTDRYCQPGQRREWMDSRYNSTVTMVDGEGERHNIQDAARTYLGLTNSEAHRLFFSYDVRSLEDLRLRVKEVCGD